MARSPRANGPRLPASKQLPTALEAQDAAAVAFALRNDVVTVPLLPGKGPAQVRVFRAPGADLSTLLLFSSAESYVRMLPTEKNLAVLTHDRAQLVEFLEKHLDVLETVWFDIAGPFPMQADPRDLLTALAL